MTLLLIVYFAGFASTLGYKVWLWKQGGNPIKKFFVGEGAAYVTVGSLFATWLLGAWLAMNPFFGETMLNLPAMALFGSASEVIAPILLKAAVEVLSNLNLFGGKK